MYFGDCGSLCLGGEFGERGVVVYFDIFYYVWLSCCDGDCFDDCVWFGFVCGLECGGSFVGLNKLILCIIVVMDVYFWM